MKKTDRVELHTKTHEELLRSMKDLKGEIMKLRMEIIRGTNKNLNSVRNKRKDLARILTVIKEKGVKNG